MKRDRGVSFEWNNATQEIAKLRKSEYGSDSPPCMCGGAPFADYIEEKWKEYRSLTNNEDAWCFKQWLVGKHELDQGSEQ